MSTATLVRPAPSATLPNGLPWKPYVYQGTGTDELTAWMDEPDSQFEELPRAGRPLRECGSYAAYHRHLRRGERVDAECRAANTRHGADRRARKRRERKALAA